jgi:hypothetical protein
MRHRAKQRERLLHATTGAEPRLTGATDETLIAVSSGDGVVCCDRHGFAALPARAEASSGSAHTGVNVPTNLTELAKLLGPRRPERLEIEQLNERLERTTRQLKYAREEVVSLSARVAASGLSEPITGLPNRNACLDAIDRTLKHLRHSPGRQVAILSVGFERLQRVADVFGYPVLDRLLLEAAIEQHQLLIGERVLLQQTLLGCLKSLLDVLALVDPVAFGRAQRLERSVRAIALEAGLLPGWPIEAAALLSQLGCLELSDVVRMKLYGGETLEECEAAEVRTAYTNVCGLLSSIPRLGPVRDIIGALNGNGGPPGAHALRLAMELDSLEARGICGRDALVILKSSGPYYDPNVLDAARRVCQREQAWGVPSEVSVEELHSGTVVAEDIRKHDGVLIVPRGVALSCSVIAHIGRFRDELAKSTVSVSSAEEDGTGESSLVVEEIQVPELSATG